MEPFSLPDPPEGYEYLTSDFSNIWWYDPTDFLNLPQDEYRLIYCCTRCGAFIPHVRKPVHDNFHASLTSG